MATVKFPNDTALIVTKIKESLDILIIQKRARSLTGSVPIDTCREASRELNKYWFILVSLYILQLYVVKINDIRLGDTLNYISEIDTNFNYRTITLVSLKKKHVTGKVSLQHTLRRHQYVSNEKPEEGVNNLSSEANHLHNPRNPGQ